MLALVKYGIGPENFGLRDIEVPIPQRREVLVEVICAGLCGTDLHVLYDRYPTILPVVMGHEFSGIIKDVGPDLDKNLIGKKIVAEPFFKVCGSCYLCQSGNYNLCDFKIALGSKTNGTFAKYTKVNISRIHLLPENISFENACLVEPFACAVHGMLEMVNIKPGDSVIVFGTGPIGILCAYLAKISGAKTILVGTKYSIRTDTATKILGIDFAVNSKEEDLVSFLNKNLNISNVDIAVECSGTEKAIVDVLGLVKKRGVVLQMGLLSHNVSVPFGLIAAKEISVIGSFGSHYISWKKVIDLISASKVDLSSLITKKYRLREYAKAFDSLSNSKDIKIIFNEFE